RTAALGTARLPGAEVPGRAGQLPADEPAHRILVEESSRTGAAVMKAVDIQGVSQRYGSMTVLHDLSLQLAEGEVLGLFGHNGAGKTTTMKLILGLLTPSEGQVKVLGQAPSD